MLSRTSNVKSNVQKAIEIENSLNNGSAAKPKDVVGKDTKNALKEGYKGLVDIMS